MAVFIVTTKSLQYLLPYSFY